MEYLAKYEIDCGDSPGFGVKYPGHFKRNETIIADNFFEAAYQTIKRAIKFSRSHLSDPDTKLTVVTLLDLTDQNGNSLKTE